MGSCIAATLRNEDLGTWILCNDRQGILCYSLVSRYGKTLRHGTISISKYYFIDYLQKVGYERLEEMFIKYWPAAFSIFISISGTFLCGSS